MRNAIKFSRPDATVTIRARKQDGRILVEVEDECGGLPPGKTEELFSPFVQKGADRTGFGLGLAIARQAAEAHNGTIKVRNLPATAACLRSTCPQPERDAVDQRLDGRRQTATRPSRSSPPVSGASGIICRYIQTPLTNDKSSAARAEASRPPSHATSGSKSCC